MATRIKALREMGITQTMLAKEMGITRQTVNLWFVGAREPSARSVKRMAEALSKLTGKNVSPAKSYTIIINAVEERKSADEVSQ